MPVIRCEACKGTGKTMQEIVDLTKPKYTTQGVIGMPIGYETKQILTNCPDCGGSGCKWTEETTNEHK